MINVSRTYLDVFLRILFQIKWCRNINNRLTLALRREESTTIQQDVYKLYFHALHTHTQWVLNVPIMSGSIICSESLIWRMSIYEPQAKISILNSFLIFSKVYWNN